MRYRMVRWTNLRAPAARVGRASSFNADLDESPGGVKISCCCLADVVLCLVHFLPGRHYAAYTLADRAHLVAVGCRLPRPASSRARTYRIRPHLASSPPASTAPKRDGSRRTSARDLGSPLTHATSGCPANGRASLRQPGRSLSPTATCSRAWKPAGRYTCFGDSRPSAPGQPLIVVSRSTLHAHTLFLAQAAVREDARRQPTTAARRRLTVFPDGSVVAETAGTPERFSVRVPPTNAGGEDFLGQLTRSATSVTAVHIPEVGPATLLRFD
jgi:hypothetical protein